jgi:hypothetical protein
VVSRRVLVAGGLVLLGAVAVAAVLAVGLRGGEPEPVASAVRPTLRVWFDPPVHHFGQPVTLHVGMLAKKDDYQPLSERIGADVSPYRVVGEARKRIRDAGDAWQLDYEVTLQCLTVECLPQGETREFAFPEGISAGFYRPAPPGRKFKDRRLDSRTARGELPPLRVTTRLRPSDTADVGWRSGIAELPEPSYRLDPQLLVALLLGLAAALAAAAAALVARWARPLTAVTASEEAVAEEPPLERALRLVGETSANGRVDLRRAALEELARELRRDGRHDLAADARRLAWSPAEPEPGDLEVLASRAREEEAE